MASQHPAPTIGDLINMTDTDTTEADDAIEQSDHRPIPPDAAFAIAFNLIALAADPRAFKKKLQGLHRALTAVDEGMARLAADRAAHDARHKNHRRTRRAGKETPRTRSGAFRGTGPI
jgi:hypothetical protein